MSQTIEELDTRESIGLEYADITFTLEFESPIKIYDNTGFIIRSVFGKELHDMCCVVKQKTCSTCPMCYTCIYAWFFETHLEKQNSIISGRTRASHPFTHSIENSNLQPTTLLELKFTLIGKGIDYLPYVFYALIRAGNHGVFKNRISFTIKDVLYNGRSILQGSETISIPIEPKIWRIPNKEQELNTNKEICIQLLTPFRYKKNGTYSDVIQIEDILLAASRRMKTLMLLYGKQKISDSELKLFEAVDNNIMTRIKLKQKNLMWKDITYYSGRQQKPMKLGGVQGSVIMEGLWNKEELSLLSAAEIFHIGKNVSFGLGRISVYQKG